MKKIFISLLAVIIFLLGAGYVTYLYRYDIFQYSAESMIMKNLPDHMQIDDIYFNAEKGVLEVRGFRILNPPGYSKPYLCQIGKLICKYQNRGSKILDGITVTDIIAENPELYIECNADGDINLQHIQTISRSSPGTNTPELTPGSSVVSGGTAGSYAEETISNDQVVRQNPKNSIKDSITARIFAFNVFSFLDLTDTIKIDNGQVLFVDNNKLNKPYRVSLDEINGTIRLVFNDVYTDLISVETRGSGIVNGYGDQKVEWITIMDPDAAELTMSNTLFIQDVDITQFKPYYEKYLPIDITSARASGDFVINFDNGNIGSTNTVRLRDLSFLTKEDTSSFRYWQGTFNEVLKYLTSSRGEIMFDFKIKGPVDNPAFYPGPYVKKAIQNMVVDKISEAVKAIQNPSVQQGNVSGAAVTEARQGGKSKTDVEKVVDIINIFLEER